MRVDLYPADLGACGNLRMRWPAEAARAAGYDVVIHEPGMMTLLGVEVGITPTGQKHARMVQQPEFDVVVFQRPLDWRHPVAIAALQSVGVRCVVELDDDLGTVDRKHIAYRALRYSADNLAEACRIADAVVVTTPRLVTRYGRTNGVVVENRIPANYLDVEPDRDPDRFIIGWTGRVQTHPGDLESTRGAIQKAIDATDATFRVLAGAEYVKYTAQLRDDPEALGGVLLAEYAQHVAQFDVGIAPLASTAFNEAKSWLKPLDYAACGVPFVCSPTSEYQRFVRQGAGIVASKPREWVDALVRLRKNPNLRADQAAAGREVAARWTIEDGYEQFVEAWCGGLPIPDVAAVRENPSPAMAGTEGSTQHDQA